ncbi:MAG: class I SAM-dependent methyltransferase [Rhodospirillaceae bacterium]
MDDGSMRTSVVAACDAVAQTYGYDITSVGPARLKWELLRQHVRPEDRVLDIGCANGIHMHIISLHCRQIEGIDISQGMLDQARVKLTDLGYLNARLHLASAESLPFGDQSFDLLYSFSTLLLVPDIMATFREISRVLRPQGIAILDITGRWNLSRFHWNRYWRDQGHFGIHAYSWREITQTLGEHGLTITEAHASGLTDQWKYLPFLHRFSAIGRLFHDGTTRDRDYRLSNRPMMRRFANRWYIVARKG